MGAESRVGACRSRGDAAGALDAAAGSWTIESEEDGGAVVSHPSTLSSAGNLAIGLYELGDVQAARDLNQDTLERRRRVLGEDHPTP